jgi:hypothetical protein
LSAEIEMWLHTAPLNDARERARLPRISPSGCGAADPACCPAGNSGSLDAISLYGEDAFLSGLAALASHVEHYPRRRASRRSKGRRRITWSSSRP